jgi:hypothetical protein
VVHTILRRYYLEPAPTTAHDGDKLGAVPEAALGGLDRDRPWPRGGRDAGIWPPLTYDHDAEYMSVNHGVEGAFMLIGQKSRCMLAASKHWDSQ